MLSDITGVADTLSTFIKDYYNDQIDTNLTVEESPDIINSTIRDKAEMISHRVVGVGINKVSDVFDMF